MHFKKSRLVIVLVLAGAILFTALAFWKSKNEIFKPLVMFEDTGVTKIFGGLYAPYNTDPMTYDDFVHHLAWTSVFGTLVSEYKVGQITGQIAESWKSNADNTEWLFQIRKQCYFENGDKISPKVVAQSFKRIALLQHKKQSHSGFTEDLVGIENLKNMDSDFSGITVDSDIIKLTFKKPKVDLLNRIGFGIYSIVHPSQYDNDGNWLNKKAAISSGPYRIKNWSDNSLQLTLNEKQTSCYKLQEKPLSEVDLVFGAKAMDINSQEIISGSSKSLMIDDSFEFLGPAESSILYIQSHKNLPLDVSLALRDVIVHEMSQFQNINFNLNRSFLPLTIKGVKSAELAFNLGTNKNLLKGISLRVPKYEPSVKSDKMKDVLSYAEAFGQLMAVLSNKYGMDIQETPVVYSQVGDSKKNYDLELRYTGVLVENPNEDILFMFKSKEGIQLPDRDGSILPLLGDISKNIPLINQKIWEQGFIIPVTHYSIGLWVKKNRFDTRDINHMLPPTNFQFIGYK